MSENIEASFKMIWVAKHYPENVPLYYGPRAAMPNYYYFKTKKELDIFIDANKQFYFYTGQILAIQHENSYYPLKKKITFTKFPVH